MTDRQQLQALGEQMPKDETGFKSAPSHYAGERETIDKQRDYLRDLAGSAKQGDGLFMGHCLATALKYRERAGKKSGTDDDKKESWYLAMAQHVSKPDKYPDPRSSRPDFVPYSEKLQ